MLTVSSLTIAEGAGVQHKNVLELIGSSLADLEEFGQVAFQTRPRLAGQHGGGNVRVALLNEQQSTLLMTYQRNTSQVRAFKLALVKAFFEMAKQLQAKPLSGAELMAQALIEAHSTMASYRARVEELEPLAKSWEKLAAATGDYSVRDAAQVLCRDGGVQVGQNRLFRHLREAQRPWLDSNSRPYQWAVDAGLVAEKISSFKFHRTNGEEQLATPQVRITAKGLQRLHRDLSPSRELLPV
ncbi:phage regulatory protein/antirepressor Ant [Pseudarthrobacter sp. PS3-L1]|uniref:phage regulatory protein/antirepressor Ant n=1 Tax=Pseudarthrobacter sp. PS3-L1 TaxID=3046207 RepID=UPI0024B985AA|nr:phage regulatory protein/antirepressor Ant [Pseudarthrobacter sp. PS3-L1]MDJ0319788.1 phage regulatory protein/antirepressor Ant [Pseudarthrobacter sp. PS3-L1]